MKFKIIKLDYKALYKELKISEQEVPKDITKKK